MRIQDKVAIITGASGGIGLATTLLFLREGARVVAGSNDSVQLASLKTAAAGLPGSLVTVELDVARATYAERLVKTAVAEYGGLDILVNNAGIVHAATVVEETEEGWQRILDVNLKGVFLCSKYAVPELSRRGGGSIVNVASINGIRGNNALAAYCASKGGVVSLTQAMAIDHAPEKIRVNCVCPGAVDHTGMVDTLAAEAMDKRAHFEALRVKHPLGRFAVPDDVAYAILFLASDEASFISGVSLPVDGARSIR